MNENKTAYVFDTSAWFTLIEDEAGADVVESLLEKANAGSAKFLCLS